VPADALMVYVAGPAGFFVQNGIMQIPIAEIKQATRPIRDRNPPLFVFPCGFISVLLAVVSARAGRIGE